MKMLPHMSVLVLSLLLASCAEQPKVMVYYPGQEDQDVQNIVWPEPPDVPHYRYAGQLIGEQNFNVAVQAEPSGAQKIFYWLTGLAKTNTSRQLVRPQDGMAGPDGRIYVTDVGNRAVFVFDTALNRLSLWEQADSHAEFIAPISITISATGEILVTDAQLARVVRLDHDGQPLGSFGDGILQRPTGIAVDPDSGNIYVTDTAAHDIKIFDKTGNLLDTLGIRGTGPGEFNGPTYLCFAGGRLYVSDTLNARIQILTPDGEVLGSIGQRGLYLGNFTHPKGITVDSDGNIYVVESYYDHLLIFNQEGEFLLPIGGTGNAIGEFFLPAGIWSDNNDRIFMADMFNGRVMIMQYLGD